MLSEDVELRKYEARLALWRTGIIGGSVTIITAIISALATVYISSEEAKSNIELETIKAKNNLVLNQVTKDNEFVGRFLDKAITEDLQVRLQFSEYMSIVSASKDQRTRWDDYHTLVKSQFEDKRDNLRDLQNTLAVIEDNASPSPREPLTAPTNNLDYKSQFEAKKTDELALSRLGEQAFKAKQFDWAIKSFEQADAVKASGVWQSNFPYYIASLYASGESDKAELAKNDLVARIESSTNNGYGYLSNEVPLGFVIRNIGDAKPLVPDGDSAKMDELVDTLVELKRQTN